MMPGTRLGRLIQLLHQRTDEQKIVWEQTVEENTYQVAFPSYIVQIGFRKVIKGFEGAIEYFIRILDEDNKTIEEATDDDLQSELQNAYKIMESLYRSVRRQTMGVDKALNSILLELENGD